MAIKDPVKVKAANINSVNIPSFIDGLDERGEWNSSPNSFSYGRNVMVDSSGNVVHRYVKRKWLPDSEGMNGEISSVYYNNHTYFFIADDGKVKYIEEGGSAWIDCGGTNSVTTTEGLMTTFLRVNDCLIVLNGVDKLRYIDLSNLQMVVFSLVADPVSILTATPTVITGTGPFTVYYGITYNGTGGGETATGPILSKTVSKSRSTWKTDGTEYLTINFNDTPPVGATSRNLYCAIALQGTTPVPSDLAMLRANIPIGDASFVDNGSIPFDIAYNTAPSENSTDGIICAYGQEQHGTAILYGDPGNPYTIYFAGITETGISFGSNNGAQRYPLNKGTNFYPSVVVGFRNNQNIPNLFVLSSNTEGIAKQSILSKKTITYGNTTIDYWDADEMNTGASGVRSPYGVCSYLGQLIFPSAEGITSIKTEANLQNVVLPDIISEKVRVTYSTISYRNFEKIVSAAWDNKILLAVPSRGYNYNNQIMVYDLTNSDRPKWYIWDIAADWIGSLTPQDQSAFLYVREGNHFFRLKEGYAAQDEDSDGLSQPFPTTVTSSLLATSPTRNSFFAINQVVAYMAEFIGQVTMTVTYINQRGKTKSKSKVFTNGSVTRNRVAGWSSPSLLYRSAYSIYQRWSDQLPINQDGYTLKANKRLKMKLPNPVVNEMKVSITSDYQDTSYRLVNETFEGINVGVIGDIV